MSFVEPSVCLHLSTLFGLKDHIDQTAKNCSVQVSLQGPSNEQHDLYWFIPNRQDIHAGRISSLKMPICGQSIVSTGLPHRPEIRAMASSAPSRVKRQTVYLEMMAHFGMSLKEIVQSVARQTGKMIER
jgi:hypothetical protein